MHILNRTGWLAVAAILALLGTLLMPSPSLAGGGHGGRSVQIIGVEAIEAGTGSFTTEGGGLCRRGTTALLGESQVEEDGDRVTFELDKTFTCDDGSGSFVMHIRAYTRPCEPTDQGRWRITSGTGAYERLSGRGRLVGTYVPGPCDDIEGIVDVFYGTVRVR